MAQRVGRGIALLFHDCGTRRGEWSAARPGRTLPPGKTRYPLYRRLGGPQGRSERAENLVPTGIRFRTVHPVVSRYTDRATGPTIICVKHFYHKPVPLFQTYVNRKPSEPVSVILHLVTRRTDRPRH